MGPDLLGVTQTRDPAWLARWLAEPEKMLEEKDPHGFHPEDPGKNLDCLCVLKVCARS